MNDLRNIINLLGKKVKIVDTEDIIYVGYFLDYTTAINNEENEWSIEIYPTKDADEGIGLFESEIKSIRALEE